MCKYLYSNVLRSANRRYTNQLQNEISKLKENVSIGFQRLDIVVGNIFPTERLSSFATCMLHLLTVFWKSWRERPSGRWYAHAVDIGLSHVTKYFNNFPLQFLLLCASCSHYRINLPESVSTYFSSDLSFSLITILKLQFQCQSPKLMAYQVEWCLIISVLVSCADLIHSWDIPPLSNMS
jgi:hypothetical protein